MARDGGGDAPPAADHAAFAAIFQPYLTDAYRLARWLTGSRADAEDVVQEAALRAFRGIAGYGGANARAWVLTITRNAAYNWLAKNRPAALVFTEDLAGAEKERAEGGGAGPPMAAPEEPGPARAGMDEIRGAMARLPAPFSEVLVLREIHELDYRTIAAVVGAPIGTVMSRLARCRRLLAAALREDDREEGL